MVREKVEITEWPDTFEDFVKEGMPPYLIFQAVEHYFPVKECRTCEFFRQTKTGYYCANGVTWDVCTGYISPNFGCTYWRARE